MTQKQIEDGADSIILTELDDAAEARIIDVLSKVFATNRYPGLKAAIIDAAISTHRKAEEAARQKVEEYKYIYQQQAALREEEIKKMLREQQTAQTSSNPFSNALGKPFKHW